MKRKTISAAERMRVYEKYGGKCAYCGQIIAYKEMQVEHMKPLALGGADSAENYTPACRVCNHYKHTLSVEKFREQIGLLTKRLREGTYIYKLALKHRRITESNAPVTFFFEREKTEKMPLSPYADGDAHILACPNCGSGEYLYNEDGNENAYCGQCGQAIEWTEGGGQK